MEEKKEESGNEPRKSTGREGPDLATPRPSESRNPFGSGNESAFSFSNKRPISIAIGICTVTRYARLMDPRAPLRCLVPFTSPYPPFYLPLSSMQRPLLWVHPYIKHLSISLSLPLSLCWIVLAHDLQILPSIWSRSVPLSLSFSLFDLIKENTRNLVPRCTRAYIVNLPRSSTTLSGLLSRDTVWVSLERRIVYRCIFEKGGESSFSDVSVTKGDVQRLQQATRLANGRESISVQKASKVFLFASSAKVKSVLRVLISTSTCTTWDTFIRNWN